MCIRARGGLSSQNVSQTFSGLRIDRRESLWGDGSAGAVTRISRESETVNSNMHVKELVLLWKVAFADLAHMMFITGFVMIIKLIASGKV